MNLVEFIEQMALADTPAKMLPLLADVAMEHARADGSAVIEVMSSGDARIVAARNLPEELGAWHDDLEVVDADVGKALLAKCQGRFLDARTFGMRSGASIFGAIVLFFISPQSLAAGRLGVAEALAALGGRTLEQAFQYTEISKSYAELRASREALKRSEKLRALGEMAAGVSHDLRNILNPLSLHLQVLKRGASKKLPADAESLEEMEQVLMRGVETIDRLRDFGRQTPDERFEPVDIGAIAIEAMGLARPRIAAKRRSRGVSIHEELGVAPRVMARSTDFVSAVVNLLINAIDALEGGGDIVVSSGRREGGGWIAVHDSGPGIPPDVQARIFEPFFTTKGTEGTGLGLAMVWAFVQRNGGKLEVETKPGAGTTFTIWFPPAPP